MYGKHLFYLMVIVLLLIAIVTLPEKYRHRKEIVVKDIARIICVGTLVAVAIMLGGCGIIPENKREVQTTVYSYSPIPDNLLTSCPASRPPEKETFITSTKNEQVKSLSNYAIDLLKDLSNCDDQISKIRAFNEKQKNIYNGKVTTE